ncbi:predicted protein [Aspergillus terreus NIH2624]|uniref:Uncharacterized protein n=1 Tax=Aspergillus terreus (strain NIH 2624 / FGSC A1156) TaxID=341663 RepID=Q0CIU0_ASPTN|nr:uncharacterized protein ATEG_06394 [Aspergillus terreus NIH2624]EAU32938.1 predicted protein [Aspergillus terreus NIH2624]
MRIAANRNAYIIDYKQYTYRVHVLSDSQPFILFPLEAPVRHGLPQYNILRTTRYFNYVVALVVYKQLKKAMHKTQTLEFPPAVKPKVKDKCEEARNLLEEFANLLKIYDYQVDPDNCYEHLETLTTNRSTTYSSDEAPPRKPGFLSLMPKSSDKASDTESDNHSSSTNPPSKE